jgi:hypothetical protein
MTTNEIQEKLDALAALDRVELASQWAVVFGCPAPRNCQATLLRSALAWHYQLSNLGRSEATDTRRLLKKLQSSKTSLTSPDDNPPGTRLLREWQGRTHYVTVLANGFEYNGKTYRSLTAITRQITGTPWSGPQFFGLRS